MDYLVLKALAEQQEEEEALQLLRSTGFPVVRVTSLLGCPRAAWYELNGVQADLEPPSRQWARLRGTLFHKALLDDSEEFTERRLAYFVKEAGAYVTGRVDWYNPKTATLVDLKTVSQKARWDVENGGYKEFDVRLNPRHVKQLNLYAWLLDKNGYPVETARVVYISMGQVKTFSIVVDTAPYVEEFIVRQLQAITAPVAPPERPPEGSKWLCKYCAYSACISNENTNLVAQPISRPILDSATVQSAIADLYGEEDEELLAL